MANGTRTLTLVLVFIVGAAAGWFVGRASTPSKVTPTVAPEPLARNHLIVVGPAAKDVSEDEAAISKGKGHTIHWIPKDETMTLKIVFKKTDFPKDANGEPPFEGGTKDADFEVPCKGGFCYSGHINHNLNPDNKRLYYYKSTQILIDASGKRDEADAGIIIQP